MPCKNLRRSSRPRLCLDAHTLCLIVVQAQKYKVVNLGGEHGAVKVFGLHYRILGDVLLYVAIVLGALLDHALKQ